MRAAAEVSPTAVGRHQGRLQGAAWLAAALFAAFSAAAANAQAADGPWELRIGASTAGYQFGASYRLSDRWRLRGVAGGLLTFRASGTLDDNKYRGDLDLGGIGLFADYYPFKRGLRLSGGVLYSLTEFRGSAEGPLNIGGEITVTRADLELAFSPAVVPAVSIGYDLPLGKHWMLGADAGVIYPLGYDAKLSVRGAGTVDLGDLLREADGIEADSPDVFPYVSLGLVYRF